MRTIVSVLSIGLALSSPANPDDLTTEEAAVWDLEKSYYRFAKENDREGYLSLFDEHVIGWPALDNRPKGKSHVSQWITTVHADASQTWNYELNRLAIKAFGDVVVVHYLLRDYFISAKSGDELSSNLYRISHTWKRYGDEWKIVSGMGSPHD